MKYMSILLLLVLNTALAQRSHTVDADCLRIKDGACIDKLELGYSDGLNSNIQDQLDLKSSDASVQAELDTKANLSGDESISGSKTFTGKIIASSTSNGFKPCPSMTEAQRNSIASPVSGDCIFNSDSLKLNVYNGTLWKAAGGGVDDWVTSYAYAVGDVVIQSSKIYQCSTAHTSGTFATDLAAVKWVQIANNVTDAVGVLPLANGGTNKNATASNGAVVYSDADSFELLAPGTSGQILQTNGAAAPSFVNKSISGKAQNASSVTVEELQVPNNLLTPTATNKYLNETGNKNILVNPSFEHNNTYLSGWSQSGCSSSLESTVVIHGTQSNKASCSSQTLNLRQNSTLYQAQFAGGVQGLAMISAKATVSGFFVCSRNNDTPNLSNCVAVSGDSKWGLYKVPFILGATDNGISIVSGTSSGGIVTTGSISGDIYLDDAFVGAVDLKQDVKSCTTADCTTEFSAFVTDGTGTTTVSRENVSSWINGNCTNASTGVYVCTYDTSLFSDDPNCTANPSGATRMARTLTGATTVTVSIYNDAGALTDGDFTVACQRQGTDYANAKRLENGSVYTAQCGANCVNEFNAKVDSAGTVTSEGVDWLNGDAVVSDTSLYTFTLTSGLFSVPPVCAVTAIRTGVEVPIAYLNSNTTSSLSVRLYRGDTMAKGAFGFGIKCAKTGSDFVATRSIVGSFKDFDYVYVRATSNAGQSIGTSGSDMIFEDEEADTHGAYSTSTGVFTVPIAGNYIINTEVHTAAVTLTTGQRFYCELLVNGTSKAFGRRSLGNGANMNHSAGVNTTTTLAAGDLVKVSCGSSVATTGVLASEQVRHSIIRVPGQ